MIVELAHLVTKKDQKQQQQQQQTFMAIIEPQKSTKLKLIDRLHATWQVKRPLITDKQTIPLDW